MATPASTQPVAGCASGCWRQVLPLGSGGFPPSPGSNDRPLWEPGRFPLTLPPLLGPGGDLWMTAQQVAYSSPDGLTWTQHAKTDWGGRIYQFMVSFKGRLWMYGGLDYEGRTFLNDIWSSADGTAWQRIGPAAWPGRGAAAVVVFHDRLWLFGGADHIADDRSTDRFRNDVWVSDDGLAWQQVTAAAPWPARDNAGVFVLRDELYLVGGQGTADVWRSKDGREWTQVTAAAPWTARHGAAHAVFDGKLWVFGGWTGQSTNALNDVWYSADGVTWARQGDHAPWAPRSPVSIVYDDKIWIYSGKHTGADDNWGGDLWQMSVTAVR